MKNELVPEIHDIGKLTNEKHNFERLDIDLGTKTWRGILEHHCSENFDKYPTCLETFILCIADSLASAVSRVRVEKSSPIYNVYKLWNPPSQKLTKPPFTTQKEVKKILEFIASNPDADEFFKEYGELLKIRAEDATPGCNITSLYTHSKLTGQFYRILMAIKDKSIKEEDINGKSKKEIADLLRKINNSWKLKVLKCKIRFSQNPVRAKDMNIFKLLENFVEDIKEKYPDNILFSTSDELLIVIHEDSTLTEYIKNKIEETGFWVEIRQETQRLGELNFEKLKEISTDYFSLPPEVDPPICEICQMRKATKKMVDENIVELLCEKCFNIRRLGATLPKLAVWEEENQKIVYIKISLNIEELIEVLRKLYISYLKEIGLKNAEEKAEIRFSVLLEFQMDYNEFLFNFRKELIDKYNEENIQQIMNDFLCVKIGKTSEIKRILEIYNKCFRKYFPKFKEKTNISPIKLSITCASAKFPFIWNWRILSNPKNEINIYVIGKGEINIKIHQIDQLLNIKLPSIKLLQQLSQAADISKKLAWAMLNDKTERKRYRDFKGLRDAVLISGLDYDNILVFAKIMGD